MSEMDFRKAKMKYRSFMKAARTDSEERWKNKFPNLQIKEIDDEAIQQAQSLWHFSPNLPPTFNWRYLNGVYSKYIRRIDLAIWDGYDVCGLAIGKSSRGRGSDKSNVTINFLQGAPHEINKLKGNVAPIAITAFNSFGYLTEKNLIYIKDPVKEVQPYYTSLGFSFDSTIKTGVYMKKPIE